MLADEEADAGGLAPKLVEEWVIRLRWSVQPVRAADQAEAGAFPSANSPAACSQALTMA